MLNVQASDASAEAPAFTPVGAGQVILEDLPKWAAETGQIIIPFETHRHLYRPDPLGYRAEGDDVIPYDIGHVDEGPLVVGIHNAVLVAAGLVTTEHNRLAWAARPVQTGPRPLPSGVVLQGADGTLRGPPGTAGQYIPEAIYLEFGSKYFGNELYHMAGIALAREVLGNTSIPLITHAKSDPAPEFIEEAIRKIGFTSNPIINIRKQPNVRVGRLWTPFVPVRVSREDTCMSSIAMAVLQHRLGVPAEPGASAGDRIYVSRQDAAYRRIANEDEVIAVLKDYGFRTLTFGGKTAGQCVEEMKDARLIFGLAGSNLTNIVFAPRGAWVIEAIPAYYDQDGLVGGETSAKLYTSFGHRYVRTPGHCVQQDGVKYVHWDVQVDCRELRTSLDFCLQQAGMN